MKLNTTVPSVRTHEGGKAKHINNEQQLRRSVMSCMLWESEFYESGQSIAERICKLVPLVEPAMVAAMAIEAREHMKLRHIPLLIVREMVRHDRHKALVKDTLAAVIQRPDELAEFLAIYWKEGRCKLAASVKKGLAKAFTKFNEYSLAKYNRDGSVKLRDVLFLCHAKPKDDEQAAVFKKLVDGTLETPDTWEVALSSGADKKETWTRLLAEKKLGALALLRNIRNMQQAGIDEKTIGAAITEVRTERVLPFRFIAAARFAPNLEPDLEQAMFRCLKGKQILPGTTMLMVDVSGSMDHPISGKSDLRRLDAACGLAMLLRETCERVSVVTFSESMVQVPPRRGFALRDAISGSQSHGGTYLGSAINAIKGNAFDRLIVISDEQSHDSVPDIDGKSYMLNVASNKNGVGYGAWTHIDGWSESVVDYIAALETEFDETN